MFGSGESNNGMFMPVAPAYSGGFGGNGGFFGGDGIWAIIILAILFNGGFGGFGGFGGMGGFAADGAMLYPWMNQAEITTSGFQNAATNQAISSLQNSVTTGFGDVQNSLCSGFASVNASVNGAQNALAQQLYTNQISDLERSFAAQTANTQAINGVNMALQNCCCQQAANTADLKYTVATEACADRAAVTDGVRDILANQTAGIQRILDQLCQDKIDAKNDEIAQLRQEILYARGQASQIAQNQQVIDGIYNRLDTCPVGTTPVYGRTPIFSCNNGCGCSGNNFIG